MYETLIDELSNDPAGIGYAAMSDEQRLTALHAENQPVRQLVPLWKIKKRLIETGAWLELQKAAAGHESEQVKAAARLTLLYVDDARFENLDFDLPSTQQLLGALVQAMIVTTDMSAEIDAMANATTSRAAILGLQSVQLGNMISARKMMEGN
jgi:hypothetical protein